MGINIRTKGASAEREVIKILQPIVDDVRTVLGLETVKLQRNALQSDSGGYDIVGIDWLALEVKRCETLSINAWWAQTVRQTGKGQTGVLIYRQSRQKWKVMLNGVLPSANQGLAVRVTVDISDFLAYFRMRLEQQWSTVHLEGSAIKEMINYHCRACGANVNLIDGYNECPSCGKEVLYFT